MGDGSKKNKSDKMRADFNQLIAFYLLYPKFLTNFSACFSQLLK